MSPLGQNLKTSKRANVARYRSNADIVERGERGSRVPEAVVPQRTP